MISRQLFAGISCGILGMSVFMISLTGCARDGAKPEARTETVVLYTSVDDVFAKMVADAFTAKTGITVDILGDTEATKTTGLVTRIQAEMAHPVGDVWWSSEPMGTILLDESGALEPGAMEGMVGEDWPKSLRAANWSWVGMAMRSRVIAYASDRVEDPPTRLSELTLPEYKGLVGMARPQFGTTRIHMAILADQWGIDSFTTWMQSLEANNLRLYDGNARVVAAIAMGEIDIGLTDTDDVWSGQSNGWKVDLQYESVSFEYEWSGSGPTLIPNTVAIIKEAPNPELAQQLAAFLVSPEVEDLLYHSTTHNTPVHGGLRARYKDDVLEIDRLPDYIGASKQVREVMDVCEQVLISP